MTAVLDVVVQRWWHVCVLHKIQGYEKNTCLGLWGQILRDHHDIAG
jgi:hypothetical protein